MKQEQARSANRSPRRRVAATGSAGVLMAVVLLMLLAAASQGVAAPRVVLTKPFKGFVTGENDAYYLGCGTAVVTKAAAFNKTAGVSAFSGHTTAPTCAYTLGNGGYTFFEIRFSDPIGLSSGRHNVSVNWSLKAAGSEVLTFGKCAPGPSNIYAASCEQQGRAYVSAYTYVEDSNGTQYYPSNNWPGFFNETSNSTVCFSGSCRYLTYGTSGTHQSFSRSTTFDWVIHLTGLPAGHHFYVVSDIYGGAYAEATANNGAISGTVGSASINFATLGNGGRLNSITVV